MTRKAPSAAKSQSRSDAWPTFLQGLAQVLCKLEKDECLMIAIKRSNRYVQFACEGSSGIRAEATSNSYLNRFEKLSKEQIAELIKVGWSAPTRKPKQSTTENDPDGSPNYFVDFPTPVTYERVAELAVNTFVDILRVPHPDSLEYEAFDLVACDPDGLSMVLPELGLNLVKRKPRFLACKTSLLSQDSQ